MDGTSSCFSPARGLFNMVSQEQSVAKLKGLTQESSQGNLLVLGFEHTPI